MSRFRPIRQLLPSLLGAAVLAWAIVAPPVPTGAQQPLGQAPQQAELGRVVRLSVANGAVRFQLPGQNDWQAAAVNLPLQQGYKLATDNGRAEVQFENGAIAQLDANAILEFTRMDSDTSGRVTRLTLIQGSGRFYVRPNMADVFQVWAAGAQVSINNLADFRVDITPDTSVVSVFDGDVFVASNGLTRQVQKDQVLTFRAADQTVAVTGEPRASDFDQWVVNRHQFLFPGITAAVRYVPPPVVYPTQSNPEYGFDVSDLYNYGTWQFAPGIGWGWQPNGIGPGWIPYTAGNWSFTQGLGYFWLSNEPWGWMPYHSGRWLYGPQGWLWVPGQFESWDPGAVRWMRLGNDFGWVPRSPQDRAGKPPANLKQGLIVNQSTGLANVQAVPQPGSFTTMRIPKPTGAQPIVEPPASMARQLAPPLSRVSPAQPPALAGNHILTYNSATHTWMNANGTPLAISPAPSMYLGMPPAFFPNSLAGTPLQPASSMRRPGFYTPPAFQQMLVNPAFHPTWRGGATPGAALANPALHAPGAQPGVPAAPSTGISRPPTAVHPGAAANPAPHHASTSQK